MQGAVRIMHERLYNAAEPVRLAVYDTERGADEVVQLVQRVLECLNPLYGTDHNLRQLWVEAQWLKTTAREGKVILPNPLEMHVFQMAQGNHAVINKYPLLKQRVESLAQALEAIIEG
jgi:hypothetical protein